MKIRKNDVCLLYNESDKDAAKKIEDALGFYSIEVWQMQNITIGNQIVEETLKVLERAKVIIILCSSASSAFLIELAADTKESKKIVIPVLIENVQLPREFLNIQPVNLIDWDGNREDPRIVKIWRRIRDPLSKVYKRRLRLNQITTGLSLLIALIGVIVGVTTPEVRCLLKLECPSKTTPSQGSSTTSSTPTPVPRALPSPSEVTLPSSYPSPSPSPNPTFLSPETNNEKKVISSSSPGSLSTKCTINSGDQSSSFNDVLTVARQAYNPDTKIYLRVNSTRSTTCQLTSATSSIVKFAYAIPDNSVLQKVLVLFYLNGKRSASLELARGEIKYISLSMKDVSSYTVELKILAGTDDYLYYFNGSN